MQNDPLIQVMSRSLSPLERTTRELRNVIKPFQQAAADLRKASTGIGQSDGGFTSAGGAAGGAAAGVRTRPINSAVEHLGSELRDAASRIRLDLDDVGGSLRDSLRRAGSSLLEGLLSPLTGAANDFISQLGSSLVGGLFGGALASGGRMQPGTLNLVGERGPELIASTRPVNVMNAADTRRGLAGRGMPPVVIHNSFDVGVRDTVRAEILEATPGITASVMEAVAKANAGQR